MTNQKLSRLKVTQSSVEYEHVGRVSVSYIVYLYITSQYYFWNLIMEITQMCYLSGLVCY